MPRLGRVKLGGNHAKATGSGKEANFYFPGLTPLSDAPTVNCEPLAQTWFATTTAYSGKVAPGQA